MTDEILTALADGSHVTPIGFQLAVSPANGKPLLTVHMDGSVEFGPGMTSDAAAREFWAHVGDHSPLREAHHALRKCVEAIERGLEACENCGYPPHPECNYCKPLMHARAAARRLLGEE